MPPSLSNVRSMFASSCEVCGRWVKAAIVALGVLWHAPAYAQADVFTLTAYGDSLTAGYGLPASEGFAPQLEAWLRENGVADVRVLNAGVSGDTTSAGLARLEWTLDPETDAVILELGANDALRGVDPDIARDNLDKMLTIFAEKGAPVLLAGMLSLQNWGKDYAERFNSMYPDLARKHGVELYPFFLEGVAGDPALNQPDGIHPNAEGVKKLVAAIGPHVLRLIELARSPK